APQTAAERTSRPTAPAHRPALRVVVRPAPHREPPFDDELDPPVATRHDRWLPFERATTLPGPPPPPLRPNGLPDPQRWARRLLVGLIETADGRRPLPQLASLLSVSVHRGLLTDFERVGAARTTHWMRNASVHSVRGCEPAAGVAELSATLRTGARLRAVALRLEERHGRWVCTRLQLG
uniref:Rv3235 family protein n=1 Tax=uncultured Jatrophihabitans sp. TaxID=1610747 RepID=UPI0035CB874F